MSGVLPAVPHSELRAALNFITHRPPFMNVTDASERTLPLGLTLEVVPAAEDATFDYMSNGAYFPEKAAKPLAMALISRGTAFSIQVGDNGTSTALTFRVKPKSEAAQN